MVYHGFGSSINDMDFGEFEYSLKYRNLIKFIL